MQDPWVEKIRWKGHGYLLQYSCRENSMDRRAWWATVNGVTNSGHDWSNLARAATLYSLASWISICSQSALWNWEKVMQVVGEQKIFIAQEPHRVLLGFLNYKLALAKIVADTWTRAFAFCLCWDNPALLQLLTFNTPWGSSGWSKALCAPGNLVGQVFRQRF